MRNLSRSPRLRSEDLRRWFLQNEVELFKWRFVNNPPDDMNLWLKAHSLNYEAVRPHPTGQTRTCTPQAALTFLAGLAQRFTALAQALAPTSIAAP